MVIHGFESENNLLPAGMGLGHSAFVRILPYLDQNSLYDAHKLELPYYFVIQENDTATNTKINSFLCISEWYYENSFTDYAMNSDVSHEGARSGSFTPNYLVIRDEDGKPLSSIRDGTDHTVASTEWLVSAPGDGDLGDVGRSLVFSEQDWDLRTHLDSFLHDCLQQSHACPFSSSKGLRGAAWTNGNPN